MSEDYSESDHDRKVKEMARGFLAVLFLGIILFIVGALLSSCATCVNRGDAFSRAAEITAKGVTQ